MEIRTKHGGPYPSGFILAQTQLVVVNKWGPFLVFANRRRYQGAPMLTTLSINGAINLTIHVGVSQNFPEVVVLLVLPLYSPTLPKKGQQQKHTKARKHIRRLPRTIGALSGCFGRKIDGPG